ncbi:scarecrow-like protein 1 isoform X2 [Macadamia integrifolia]|uniref:scarecrow-like protein 1 isoform X2 n=1 Tax=Macadamia integrifolia TaxID=60698 RepID=UPI001C4E936C|nr:scarecrow-like protein 1 isoform X2 [Macadamia integrifolia]
MSLVKPADPSATSYGKSQLYMLKGSSDTTRLSSQAFSSDKRKFKYGPESYCCESYNQQYFSESPGEDFLASQNEFCHPSSTDVSRFSSQAIGHPDGYQSQSSSEYYGQSPENGTLDYEDDDIRFKLKELERELLNDNDDNERFVLDQSMDIDGEWTGPIKDLLLPNSPKESSSSDSNLSSISSNKETSLLNHVSTPNSSRTPTAKQLLFECAAAISDGNMEEAAAIIAELRQRVSIQGDPAQRIAAYMVEGLAARMAASGKFLYKALKCKEPPTLDRLAAMQILFEVCPCFKFGFMAANGAIAEAFKDEERVHIIDFDVNQGSQYMTLIQAFAARPGKPPNVRITGVDDPESVQRTVGGLNIIGQRLEKLAEQFGVPFEFRAVPAKTEDVTPAMLDCRPSEALVVNFAFQLHHMPDESVSTLNQRDQLLRMVKSLNPKLVTVVEQDVNTNTAPFFPRFVEAYNYYSAVFESLDATLSRESPDRINVERQCLARDIVNIVACEGEERIERYELAGKWRARMMMAGFQSCPLSAYVNETIRKLLKQYCDRYKIKEEGGALHFGWEERILVVASAWK